MLRSATNNQGRKPEQRAPHEQRTHEGVPTTVRTHTLQRLTAIAVASFAAAFAVPNLHGAQTGQANKPITIDRGSITGGSTETAPEPAKERAAQSLVGLLSPTGPVGPLIIGGGYVLWRQSGSPPIELPTIDNPFARNNTSTPPPPMPPRLKYGRYVLATGSALLLGREVYAFHANRTPDRNGKPVKAEPKNRGKIVLVAYDQDTGIRRDMLCGSLTAVAGLGLAVNYSSLFPSTSLNCTRAWVGPHSPSQVSEDPLFVRKNKVVRPIVSGYPQPTPQLRR